MKSAEKFADISTEKAGTRWGGNQELGGERTGPGEKLFGSQGAMLCRCNGTSYVANQHYPHTPEESKRGRAVGPLN